ncbi:transposase DNA-binding-containing protein [Cupriavidus sp. CuC1]|uniref:transposase DNA-binding-containing protein n=1 Tax=Cupriavidus sp. CuC1 TaxID=3373131 RepID=UPI0037CE00A7
MDGEVADSNFRDFRLHKRFRTLLGRLWRRMGEIIPFACEDWASTNAEKWHRFKSRAASCRIA